MRKRLLAILFSSALLLASLAGCGQENGDTTASTDSDTEARDELVFVNTLVRCTLRLCSTTPW